MNKPVWILVCVLAACGKTHESPGDCEVLKTHWAKLVEADSGDPATALRMYDVCKRDAFGAPYIECMRAATDVQAGIACGPKLAERHRKALAAAHEAADKAKAAAPPAPVEQPPQPPVVWPAPQPPGPAYLIAHDTLWMVGVDGKVQRLGSVDYDAKLLSASNGDAFEVRSSPVAVGRISGASVKWLPAPKLKGYEVQVDANADHVALAVTDDSKSPTTKVSVLQNGAWSAPEAVAGIGAVTGIMLEGSDDLWLSGTGGLARRRGGTWKTWPCPDRGNCYYSALGRRGTTPIFLLDDAHRWRTLIVNDKDELEADMPTGVDWASKGAGRNGELLEADGTTVRVRLGHDSESVTVDWDIGWGAVLDGSSRAWYRANGGLAVTDIQHKTSVLFPSGSPLLPGAPEPTAIAIVGGGPTLPSPQGAKVASKVTGKVKVNGGLQANTAYKFCPSMRDAGASDPCAKSKPEFSGTTDANGAFETADVPAGDYDFALYMKTSKGNDTWAVMRPGFTVRAGAKAALGTLSFDVAEIPHFGP